ncbi:hypothetical protein D3C81_2171340 [compost metagenome]
MILLTVVMKQLRMKSGWLSINLSLRRDRPEKLNMYWFPVIFQSSKAIAVAR